MTQLANNAVYFLSIITLAGVSLACFLLVLTVASLFNASWAHVVRTWSKKYILIMAFAVTLISTGGSLFLSEVANLPPCRLCWFQRIFMYPQLILFALTLIIRTFSSTVYSIVLSLIGAGYAVYHIYLQSFAPPTAVCSLNADISCNVKPFVEFGFVTIPVMSLTAFVLLLLLMTLYRMRERSSGTTDIDGANT